MPSARVTAEPAAFWREAYAGADVTSDVWLLYSGVTLAPTSDIYGNGLRLRAAGGYGRYKYNGFGGGDDPKGKARTLTGTISYAEALVGYQYRFGELTAKAFLGITAIDHMLDVQTALGSRLLTDGMEYGAKGVIELWLNLGSDAWTSLDLSWTSAHQTYAGRWRLGYRVLPTVSVGLEAAVNGNWLDRNRLLQPDHHTYRSGRAGLFARYEWNGGEVSISGGLSDSAYGFGGTDGFDQWYGTLNWLMRF